MNVIIKPIMFFLFIMWFLLFVNILVINIVQNNVGIILQEASYAVESSGSNKDLMEEKIREIENKNQGYEIELQYQDNNDFRDTTKVTVSYEYDYIALDKTREVTKSNIVMNKQI